MKIYRCFIGVLLVFFLTLAVLYITTTYNEQRSVEEGVLILHDKDLIEEIKGEEKSVAGHYLC